MILVVVGLAGSAAAQPSAPNATTVLGNVQRFYANASHLTAQFRQVVTNTTFHMSRTSNGGLWVAKPALFRWDYLEKTHGQVAVAKTFAFDGTTLWVIDHKSKLLVQNQTQGGTLPAAVSFLTGGASLTTQFNVAFNTSGTYGGNGATVLELTPKQPSAQYKQLFFVVDPSDWHVSESVVIDSSGDINDFRFYNPDFQAAVKATLFQVSPASVPTYKLVVVGNAAGSASGSGQAPATAPVPSTGTGSGTNPRP